MTNAPARRARHGRTARVAAATVSALALTVAGTAGMASSSTFATAPEDTPASVHDPVDPADWERAEDTTWADYQAIPDTPQGWTDGSISGSVDEFRAAVVMLDFEDQEMLLTQEAGSHVFGNPQEGWEPVEPEDAAQWFADYLNTPNEFNEGRTLTEYWMENSGGKYSVDVEAFGIYELPGKLHEYGLAGYAPVTGENSYCPAGDDCTKDIRDDGFDAWFEDQGEAIAEEFDVLFFVTAGNDESGTWQEFGEMKFTSKEDVPAEFGPPGAVDGPVYNDAGNEIPNWAPTRYVEWTSWKAASMHWPNASPSHPIIGNSTQAESSGQAIFQHELVHLLGIFDNYSNPFATGRNASRSYSGHWDLLSRGAFNGPGGTHNRWQIPNAGGGALAAPLSLRNKLKLDLVEEQQVVDVTTDELTAQGLARATLTARSVNRPDLLTGMNVTLSDGDQRTCAESGHVGDLAYLCDVSPNYRPFEDSPGIAPLVGYPNYTIEAVGQMGADSFSPSSGVKLAQTKPVDYSPFLWLVDANPEDIGWVDFVRPDGTTQMVTLGDPRQLNDALFRAGTRSGSEDEYVDEENGVHFYILDRLEDENGVVSYDVAVRSLDGDGAQTRGVEIGGSSLTSAEAGTTASVSVPVTNTGGAGEGVHGSDVYRVEATLEGSGWSLTQPYELVGAEAGETVQVPLHLAHTGGGDGTLTVTVTSESDPEATQTVTLEVYDLVAQHLADTVDALQDSDERKSVKARFENFLQQFQKHVEAGRDQQAQGALDRMEQALRHVSDEALRQQLLDAISLARRG